MKTDKKQPVPAAIKYQATGELPPIDYNWVHLIHVCKEALTTEREFVILPVREEQSIKQHRVRLVKDDKASPRGLILRNDEYALQKYYPYAPARFNAEELATYAAKRFNELTADQLAAMSDGLIQPDD